MQLPNDSGGDRIPARIAVCFLAKQRRPLSAKSCGAPSGEEGEVRKPFTLRLQMELLLSQTNFMPAHLDKVDIVANSLMIEDVRV